MSERRYHTERTALIDADHLAYQQAAAAHANQDSAHEMNERIQDLLAAYTRLACCTKFITVFSCSREDNFRRGIYAPYKTNRTAEPPAMLDAARQLLAEAGPTITRPKVEADDVMGILQTNGKIAHTVIVSVDKDMRSIPGLHLNPTKDDFPVRVTLEEADHAFYVQWLTGDPTDGYPGIKGVGKVKAEKIIRYAENGTERAILEAYRNAGKTPFEAMEQAACARILRAEDWSVEGGPILWEPGIDVAEVWEEEVV